MLIGFQFLVDVQAGAPLTLDGATLGENFRRTKEVQLWWHGGWAHAWSDLGTHYWRILIRGQGMAMSLLAPSHHLSHGLGPPRLCPLERDMRSGDPQK
jgi:hypothetical protein